MKITKYPRTRTIGINTFSLISISLLWGMMLGLIPWWWLFALVPSTIVAYGSELTND